MIQIRRIIAWMRIWRSQAYSRGYRNGIKSASELDARSAAWVNFLERYYYEHQNCHLRNRGQ